MTALIRLVPAGLALAMLAAAAGCGSASQSSGTSSGSAGVPATSQAAAGPAAATGAGAAVTGGAGVSATVSAVPDPARKVIVVTAAVSGPARLYGGCQATLQVSLVDPSGAVLPATASPGAARCLAITDVAISAGQTQTFTATLPLPAGHGQYTVRSSLYGGGELPPVSLGL